MYEETNLPRVTYETFRMLNLSRSHSWQGFGSKEIKRQVRQQAFWQSQLYEQVSGSDLGLPPPPPAPPPSAHSAPNSPATAKRAPRSSSRSPGRNGGGRSGGRYRPLSKSPSPMRLSGGGGEGDRPVRNRSSSRKRREERKERLLPTYLSFIILFHIIFSAKRHLE